MNIPFPLLLYLGLWLFFVGAVALLGRLLSGPRAVRAGEVDIATAGLEFAGQTPLTALAAVALVLGLVSLLWVPVAETGVLGAIILVLVLLVLLLHIMRHLPESMRRSS
ncbi:MAG TPA: hypothetical protein EYQ31_14525 [Candidatus Handelsmanbacteria bacterium]|nr:hypothetical protein [Candidatus Handelsmanbacteria bacterium]